MILLSICIIALALGIGFIVLGNVFSRNSEWAIPVGVIVILVDIIFGFGLACCLNPNYAVEENVKFTYAKTGSYVFVEFNQENAKPTYGVFDDTFTYKNIDSTTKARSHNEYDIYGFNVEHTFILDFNNQNKSK